MTQRTVSATLSGVPLLLVIGTSAAMLGVRLLETQGDPLVYVRVALSLGALGIVFAGRRNLLRSAVLAFALEATGGILTFIYVDVPFVNAHRTEIGGLALTLQDRLAGDPVAR